MKIKDLMPEGESNIQAIIEVAKDRTTPAPDINQIKAQLDPERHQVMDHIYRKDKPVKKEKKVYDQKTQKWVMEEYETTEPVNRIAIAMQDLIVERAVAFLFGNEPKMTGDIVTDGHKDLMKLVEKIKTANKVNDINRMAARTVFSATEVAEYWYPVPADNYTRYGIPTTHKLRCRVYDPLKDDLLFPRFDEAGDFVTFGAEYRRKQGLNTLTYFDLFTDEEKATFVSEGFGDWKVHSHIRVPIGKMPIVYGAQGRPEWYRVQRLCERLNVLLSNFADTNDYHASPKIFIEGILKGFAKKGEAGAILEGEKGSSAKYLSWDHAPESIKLEIDTLLSNIYGLTQTPNISFDTVKGLGAMSGIALKLLFLDAHLKVKNKEEIFSPYLQRRNSILTSYAGLLDSRLEADARSLDLYDTIVPFMIEDQKEMVETLMAANGNQPIVSHQESIRLSPFGTDNPEAEYEQIKKEVDARSVSNVFETVYQ